MTLANLAWLIATPTDARAVVIVAGDDPVPAGIPSLFRQVERFTPDQFARLAAPGDGLADFVLVSFDRGGAVARPQDLLGVVHARLRAGGVVAVACGNAWWSRVRPWQPPAGGEATVPGLRRAFLAAGLRGLQEYYLHPWPAPSSIIPARTAATAAAERLEHVATGLGSHRSRLARAGLHALLYQGIAFVGYR